MSDTDPILRAISDGNTACPDGRALAKLGELIRDHSGPSRPVELTSRVRLHLESDAVRIVDDPLALSSDEEAAIDALWDSDRIGDSEHLRLRTLISSVKPPAAIDLTAAVRRSLSQVEPATLQDQHPRKSRWGMWSAVIAAHVAALLAITLYQSALHPSLPADSSSVSTSQGGSDWISGPNAKIRSGGGTAADPQALMPVHLPSQWSDVQVDGQDLFLLRRSPEIREAARLHYGMDASHEVVRQGVAWLQSQDSATGIFGTLSGNPDRDLATQSLATLALLGEGLDDQGRLQRARASLSWIAGNLHRDAAHAPGAIPSGMAAMALVEGAALTADPVLRANAEQALHDLDQDQPPQPGAAGLGGFTLLALETATQENMAVPSRLLIQARRTLARSIPQQEDDTGRLGLAAFSRMIYGFREQPSTIREVRLLNDLTPSIHEGKSDPLGWFFATLAMREAGGAAWTRWSTALQVSLVPQFQKSENALAHIPSSQVHYAGLQGGDIFATSLALLNLQVAYRYLPLANN